MATPLFGRDIRRSRLPELLMQQGMSAEPVQHWAQGLGRVAQALMGGYLTHRERQGDEAQRKKVVEAMLGAPGLREPAAPPAGPAQNIAAAHQPGAPGAPAIPRQDTAPAFTGPGLPGAIPPTQGPPPQIDQYANAISRLESSGRYNAVGPIVNKEGNRAYGKYQVMDFNIGPWTREVLGREMTAAEFLQDPQAQDAVFQAKFGQYVAKHGPQNAAAMWFSGRPLTAETAGRKDVTGTTVAQYVDKFNAALPNQPPPAQPPGQLPAQPPAQSPGVNIPPQAAAYIRALLETGDPTAMQMAMQVYGQFLSSSAKGPEYGFMTLPDGTVIRTDKRAGTVAPVMKSQGKTRYGVIGKDQYGNEIYGWIDEAGRTTTPAGPQAVREQEELRGRVEPTQGPPPDGIPPPPPGVSPKIWRDEMTREAVKERSPKTQRELESGRAAQTTIAGFTLRDARVVQEDIPNMADNAIVRIAKAKIPGTPEYNALKYVESLRATVAIEQLLNIKRQGSGLGQVPQAQLDMLSRLMGDLDIGLPKNRLSSLVRDIQDVYITILDRIPAHEREMIGIAEREYQAIKAGRATKGDNPAAGEKRDNDPMGLR